MKRGSIAVLGFLVVLEASAQLPKLDDLLKGAGNLPKVPA